MVVLHLISGATRDIRFGAMSFRLLCSFLFNPVCIKCVFLLSSYPGAFSFLSFLQLACSHFLKLLALEQQFKNEGYTSAPWDDIVQFEMERIIVFPLFLSLQLIHHLGSIWFHQLKFCFSH
jgi:hypothetical protein